MRFDNTYLCIKDLIDLVSSLSVDSPCLSFDSVKDFRRYINNLHHRFQVGGKFSADEVKFLLGVCERGARDVCEVE